MFMFEKEIPRFKAECGLRLGFMFAIYKLCVCVTDRETHTHHSGVELRRMGQCDTGVSEGSDMGVAVTPIFFKERSSVTEMEREN